MIPENKQKDDVTNKSRYRNEGWKERSGNRRRRRVMRQINVGKFISFCWPDIINYFLQSNQLLRFFYRKLINKREKVTKRRFLSNLPQITFSLFSKCPRSAAKNRPKIKFVPTIKDDNTKEVKWPNNFLLNFCIVNFDGLAIKSNDFI